MIILEAATPEQMRMAVIAYLQRNRNIKQTCLEHVTSGRGTRANDLRAQVRMLDLMISELRTVKIRAVTHTPEEEPVGRP
jgi:hypothetical protein